MITLIVLKIRVMVIMEAIDGETIGIINISKDITITNNNKMDIIMDITITMDPIIIIIIIMMTIKLRQINYLVIMEDNQDLEVAENLYHQLKIKITESKGVMVEAYLVILILLDLLHNIW